MAGMNPRDAELMLALVQAEEVDTWHDGGQVRKAIDDIKFRLLEEGYIEDSSPS